MKREPYANSPIICEESGL